VTDGKTIWQTPKGVVLPPAIINDIIAFADVFPGFGDKLQISIDIALGIARAEEETSGRRQFALSHIVLKIVEVFQGEKKLVVIKLIAFPASLVVKIPHPSLKIVMLPPISNLFKILISDIDFNEIVLAIVFLEAKVHFTFDLTFLHRVCVLVKSHIFIIPSDCEN